MIPSNKTSLYDWFHATESDIAERSQVLKNKDDAIANLEKAIEEKSKAITSMQGEIASLQVCNLKHNS